MIYTPRPYQNDCRERIRNSYAKGKRAPILVIPTGSGKTLVAADIVHRTNAKGNSVYVLVHRQELLRQASDKLDAYGVPHGIIAPGFAETPNPIQVASVWTLVRRLKRVPKPSLLIIDEAHHALADTWKKILTYWSESLLLGLTATPTRLDGQGLGKLSGGFFDDLILGPSIKDLIGMGYLTRPMCYGPSAGIDLSNIHTVAGDYDKHEIAEVMDKPKITGCAVEHYQKICPGVPFIAFATNIAHAEHIAGKFNDAGIPCMSIDGTMDDRKRKYVLDCYTSGRIKGLSSCDLISEGFDVPSCGCTILLRPTQSEGLFLQQPGRGMRPYPGRTVNYVLDHVGNCHRHGLPTSDRHWTLEGRRRRRTADDQDVPKARQCGSCFMWYDTSLDVCPGCGAMYVPKKRLINQVAGELKLMSESDVPAPKKRYTTKEGYELRQLVIQAKRQGLPVSHAFRIFHTRKRERETAAFSM
jgi:DNA repair protein RadD